MKWSFKLVRLWGIDVYVHYTFLLLLLWAGYQSGVREGHWAAALGGMGFLLSLFVCVLLHEYGHALAARQYGIPTRDITLLPIGGVARLERMPEDPRQELVIAVAGPLINVVIASGLAVGLVSMGEPLFALRNVEDASLFQRLLLINVSLVVFNLLPAFPMDGGRVLRALLALMMDWPRATRIAAGVGKVMAAGFLVVAIFLKTPMLGLIAVFVWMGATSELAAAETRFAVGNTPVFRAMLSPFQVIAPTDSLGRAAQLMVNGSQQEFPVVLDGVMTGVLTRENLFAALARDGEAARVGGVALEPFVSVEAAEPLAGALAKLAESECSLATVASQGRVIGILTLGKAREFVEARRLRPARAAAPPVLASAAPPVVR